MPSEEYINQLERMLVKVRDFLAANCDCTPDSMTRGPGCVLYFDIIKLLLSHVDATQR